MRITATELRQNLYRVLDRIAETGEPVEIERNGRVLRIAPEEQPARAFSSKRLQPRPDFIEGDPDTLPLLDGGDGWKPFGSGT